MYFVFDIGGTKTRLALSDGTQIENVQIIQTPKNFDHLVETVAHHYKQLTKNASVQAAGGGVRGVLDKLKSKVTDKKLLDWIQVPLRDSLEKALGTRVFLENDAALAGLGEAVYGAGRDKEILAYLTISSGVGGARIVNKKIDKSSQGFEPGSQVVQITPSDVKTLEYFISGESFEKRYGSKPQDLADPEIWQGIARFLAAGLNNLAVHWSPDIIVIGGSMSLSLDLDLVNIYYSQFLSVFPVKPPVVKSQLGDTVGLYGALEYTRQMLKS